MLKYFIVLMLLVAGSLLVATCKDEEGGSTTGDADTDSDSDSDSDVDTDTATDTTPPGDYWVDGFCGNYAAEIPASQDCGEYAWMGMTGCCDADGRNLWCELGKLWCAECATGGTFCGWNELAAKYDCGLAEAGQADPSGTYPLVCAPQETDTDDGGSPDAG